MASFKTKAFAAYEANKDLKFYELERRELLGDDVHIEIVYSGVCHSDLHVANNDWGFSSYPIVPGHEIAGKVKQVGENVTKFKAGDIVGVGCMVDSCKTCAACEEDFEQHCLKGMTMTYGSEDKHLGGITHGGYSKEIIVNEDFVLSVSEKLDLKAVAPLLCAGITTYSPLKKWNIKAGDKVAIVGLGGLGHMGVKFAKAMGANVTIITTSKSKGEDGLKLGAEEVLLSNDEMQMEKNLGHFDFILNTIPVSHDINPYVGLLRYNGTMVIVGAICDLPDVSGGSIIMGGKNIVGSLIGGIKETQEMLDFCADHNIVCDIELINMENINDAYKRMVKSDVKYRFVIDMAKF